jgi:hypothetical protein
MLFVKYHQFEWCNALNRWMYCRHAINLQHWHQEQLFVKIRFLNLIIGNVLLIHFKLTKQLKKHDIAEILSKTVLL